MNNVRAKQNTQLNFASPHVDTQVIDGILYFTVVSINRKQKWKTDGTRTIFVANV